MAFWIKKREIDKGENEKESESSGKDKKKDEKKGAAAKRIDNLRIPQQLRIHLKSLGTQNEYAFLTKDLSATGAFVICTDVKRYPFQTTSTLLDACVELKTQESVGSTKLHFICKIARVVEGDPLNARVTSGFGIRIIQIAHEQRQILEQFIARHGAPEVQTDGGSDRPEDLQDETSLLTSAS